MHDDGQGGVMLRPFLHDAGCSGLVYGWLCQLSLLARAEREVLSLYLPQLQPMWAWNSQTSFASLGVLQSPSEQGAKNKAERLHVGEENT